MRLLEYGLVLHAQGSEIIDVEEAPIVDLIGGDAPGCEPEGLLLEEFVQPIRTCRRGGIATQASDGRIDGLRDEGLRGAHRRQTALVDLLIAVAFGDLVARMAVPLGQMTETGNQAFEFGARLARQRVRGHERERGFENARIALRVERKAVI